MSSQVLNQINFALESVWGTEVAPAKSMEVDYSGGFNTDNAPKYVEGIKAVPAKEHDTVIGARKHTGDFTMDLFTKYPGYFMLTALGSVSSALKAGETIVYQHTMTENVAKPSLTIEQAYGEDVSRFLGSIADDLKFTFKAGDYAKLDVKMQAKSRHASVTKTSAAYIAQKAFDFSQLQVKVGGTTYSALSVELEYKNNLQLLPALNSSHDPAFNYVKASEVTGKIEFYLDSSTINELANYLNGTNVSIEVIGTGAAIGSASNEGIDIVLPVCTYEKEVEKLADGYNSLELDFKGIYDTATGKLISVVLTNTLTAYN